MRQATQPPPDQLPATSNKPHLSVVISGAAGNLIEWFDFAVYGYLAVVMGQNFFPSDDPSISMIAAFSAFAAGYLCRPLGGAFFGYLGDKYGEKVVLVSSVLAMGAASGLIAIMPTYESIGVWAAVGLTVLRMVQGFSVGGEFTGSIVFLVKAAPVKQRGFIGSTSNAGAILGFIVGSAVVALLSTLLSNDQLASWGWRIPFAAGFVISIIVLLMRARSLTTSAEPVARDDAEDQESPFFKTVLQNWRVMLQVATLVACANIAFYAMFVYAVDLLSSRFGVASSLALDINTGNMVLMAGFILLGGWLSDRIGRRRVLFIAAGGLLLFPIPLAMLMYHSDPMLILLGQAGFALFAGLGMGVNPVTLVEITPSRVRNTVISLSYNITLGLFGGTTPVIAAWLVRETKSPISPEYYIMIAAALALVVVGLMREPMGHRLD